MRTTRSALWFHPGKTGPAKPGTPAQFIANAPACTGEPSLIPGGQKVTVETEFNGRLLLRLDRGEVPGWVWADKSDLVPLPGT